VEFVRALESALTGSVISLRRDSTQETAVRASKRRHRSSRLRNACDLTGTLASSSEVDETIRRPSSDCEDGPSLWKSGQAEDVTLARFRGGSNEEE